MGLLAGNANHESGSIFYQGQDLMLLPEEDSIKFAELNAMI